jgi:SM-20-related protein
MTALAALTADAFSRDPSQLADALRDHGACWIAGWPDVRLQDGLREDLRRLQSAGGLSQAAIGRNHGRIQRDDIRTDTTCWLDDSRCGEPARTFLTQLDAVRTMLNRTLFLGLTECEAHYAAYPINGGYLRHRDRFHDSDARMVSWVTYLNADWGRNDGGALRLYFDNNDADDTKIDLPPIGGSVCFLSELEHEVLPARCERLSIAAWFRRA